MDVKVSQLHTCKMKKLRDTVSSRNFYWSSSECIWLEFIAILSSAWKIDMQYLQCLSQDPSQLFMHNVTKMLGLEEPRNKTIVKKKSAKLTVIFSTPLPLKSCQSVTFPGNNEGTGGHNQDQKNIRVQEPPPGSMGKEKVQVQQVNSIIKNVSSYLIHAL